MISVKPASICSRQAAAPCGPRTSHTRTAAASQESTHLDGRVPLAQLLRTRKPTALVSMSLALRCVGMRVRVGRRVTPHLRARVRRPPEAACRHDHAHVTATHSRQLTHVQRDIAPQQSAGSSPERAPPRRFCFVLSTTANDFSSRKSWRSAKSSFSTNPAPKRGAAPTTRHGTGHVSDAGGRARLWPHANTHGAARRGSRR